MSNTNLVLGANWSLDEWPDFVAVTHEGTCEGMRTYVPERTCKVRQSYFDSDDELHELMEGVAFSPEDTVVCICDACKLDWRYDRGVRPNYFPNCGAKAVDD